MRRFGGHAIGVERGEVVLFSDFETGGAMWDGEGPRQSRTWVHFPEPFLDVAAVMLALSMWDISNGANARADVLPEDIARDGFAILFRTWGDTRIARVRVSWTAFGPVRDEEAWEVS